MSMPKDTLKPFEKVLYAIFFFLFSENFIFVFAPAFRNEILRNTVLAFASDPQANPIQTVQLFWTNTGMPFLLHCVFAFSLISFIARPQLLKGAVRAIVASGIVVLLLLALASLLWSAFPMVTLQELLHLFELTLIGLYISQRFSLEEILGLLVSVFAIAGALSVLAIWLNPRQSIHPGGEWRGIYTWKNFLGRFMALGNMSALVYWLHYRTRSKRILALLLFVLTAILIFFSRSTTSFSILVLVYSGLILLFVWKKWIRHATASIRWGLIALAIFVLALGTWQFDIILSFINKTDSIESRFTLWGILWGAVQEHPWLGVGYAAFWAQFPKGILPPGPGWNDAQAHHAHSGYLDVALTLGLIGLVIFLVVLALTWKRTLQNYMRSKLPLFLWPCMALAHFTLSNLAYSVGLEFPLFFWVLFIILSSLALRTTPDQPASLPQQPST